MGEIIVRKVEGMNWKAKISLVLIFTLVLSTFMHQGLYKPGPVQAAITTPQAWSTVYQGTGFPGTYSYTVNAGSNRMLVVAVASSTTANATQTVTVTYGGQSLTQQLGDGGTSARQHTYLFYLKDTPSVMNGSAQNLVVSVSGGTSFYNNVFAAVYAGVDQSATPISNSKNYTSGTGTTGSPAFGTALAIGTGEQAVEVVNLMSSSSTTVRNIQTWATNWSQGVASTGYGGGTSSQHGYIGIDTTAGSTTSNHTLSSTSCWASMTGMSIKVAPVSGTVNVGDGTDPANYTVYRTDNKKVADSFTLSANTGSATVTAITASVTNSANINGIRLYSDSGTIGTYEQGIDTLLASGTPGATVTFSGLSEDVSPTAANYLIVVDIAGTATAGQTVDIAVTGITVTAPGAQGTISDAANPTRLTIGSNTLTVGDGTSPSSPKTVYRTETNKAVSEFTLQTNVANTTVSQIVVTNTYTGSFGGSGQTETSAVNIYEDNGTTPHEWDAGDTLIASTTFATNIATFSGLSIPVTTTASRYIITYDISNTATSGRTLQAAVTGITTSANSTTNNDNNDATLQIGSNTLTAGNGTNPPSPVTVYRSETNKGIDTFTLSVSAGTTTVSSITVTNTAGGGGSGQADTSAVSIWKDTGSTANNWDAGDTLIASTTFATNTAIFSGLSIPVISGTTDTYIITVDISATAVNGHSLNSQISSITSGANTDTDNDTAGSTLNIGTNTVTVGDGTSPPSPKNVQQGSSNNAVAEFLLSTNAGTATVSGLVITGTNTGNVAASGVKLWLDNGTTANDWDAGDTQVDGAVSFSGTTATFTGLSIPVTTTQSRYIVTYNIAVGATVGQTLTGYVSAITHTANTTTNNDNTDATLTVTAGTCTRSAPTVTLGTNGTVMPGGNKTYTVTVKNNDVGNIAFCGSPTFALSIFSETGNTASFTLPSVLGVGTTGALAPQATFSTSLTVSAKLSAVKNETLTTTVRAADGVNHAAQPGSASVTTTVIEAGSNMLHNSINMAVYGSPKNYWSGQGGWGISGGVYGEFTCSTCHAKSTTNISRVKTAITVSDTSKGNIPGGSGSPVNFQSKSGTTNGFGDDQSTHTTSTRICEVCHTQPAKHKYNQSSSTLHENTSTTPANYQDCIQCHEHRKGFALPGCLDCHAKQQGNRVAVVGQFSGNSHHIQGVDLSNTQCYQCHWEANANGSINYTYHLGWRNGQSATSNAAVDLVVWGNSTTRPVTYSTSGTITAVQFTESPADRTEYAKINTHCLGCHNDANLNTQPFGDGNKTSQYAWDGTSVDARYSQAGTTTWGKYTTYPNAATKNITKAYSAHGNAATNQRGWNTTTGYDSTPPDTSGAEQVLCFDCHNSHGSTVEGTTSSYASDTTNGAIMKDTTAGLGGYAVTYKPQASDGSGSLVAANAGGSLCFDCHMTANADETTPWGYSDTFNATQAIIGYNEKPGWKGAANTNPAGAQSRYAYKNKVGSQGGHFGASSPLSTTPMGTINGLCTPCHDPHGVTNNTAKIAAADKQYAVPLLKGTWMTSPYKEDAAPANINEQRGGGRRQNPLSVGSTPGYHIDQNTFPAAALPANRPWTWNWGETNKLSEADTQFGGLCLSCHAKADLNPTTGASTWKGVDRIHNTVKGWGGAGANAGNAIHAFSCSKCHTPHNSCLPRLMITNCIDYSHRGRVGQNGTVRSGSNTYTGQQSGSRGRGNGRFPAGGGGYGDSPDDWNRGGAYFFGIAGTSQNSYPAMRQCHDGSNTTWPDEQWNSKTPWTAP